MTSGHLQPQDITSFSHSSSVILVHSSTLFHSSVTVVSFLAITLSPMIFQIISIGFRSGHWFTGNCFTHSAVWQEYCHDNCWLIGRCLQWRNCMLLKDFLICRFAFTLTWRCIRVPTPAEENISQSMTISPPSSLTSLCTRASIFPQFDNEHIVSHQTQID